MSTDSLTGTGTTRVVATHPELVTALEWAFSRDEVGLQVAAYLGDELLAEAHGGLTARNQGAPVTARTLFPIFSVTKAITALALHRQVALGYVDYEAPVAAYWPEFAANGKAGTTVSHVLTHRSGVPHLPAGVDVERLDDWQWMVDGLAALEPVAPAGTKSTYQALSFGWLVGEVVRRTDPKGRPFRDYVREEILDRIGVDDFWLGLPASEEHRVAILSQDAVIRGTAPPLRSIAIPDAVNTVPDVFNRRTVHAACIPGAGGIATARAVARCMSVLANRGQVGGVALLAPEQVDTFSVPRPDPLEMDDVIGYAPYLGTGGFWLGGQSPPAEPIVGSSPHILCQTGTGGSLAWADPDIGLSVAICHNRLFRRIPPLPPDRHPYSLIGDVIRDIAAASRTKEGPPK
ncbi:MAG TPA: serine hydrolase domain-containing protein [Acidimicrobiales bacterium]|nr:serine hydrolase domain-containing protein [Acidimicrobiales bacterium]